MKFYKLWLEIEEIDYDSGEYRNLSEEGEAVPVPVAVFESLENAKEYAEAFAMDSDKQSSWLGLVHEIN